MTINSRPFRGLIRPKISTMPRPKTEATAYLNIYKLTVEKKRLQDELQHMEERKGQIEQRLRSLYQEIEAIQASIAPEETIDSLEPPTTIALAPTPQTTPKTTQGFETQFLEY